jgi:chemotaxis response regulator CheB
LAFAASALRSFRPCRATAIASGCVDFILTPEEIALKIVSVARRAEALAAEK